MDRTYKYHFTPPKGWMNDPNGLVYINGVYHLFYQHYPEDIVWGPMHWGHAVSTDLLHWEHKPIAIFPGEEQQSVAYSMDFETFTKYEGNPVMANRMFIEESITKENPQYKKDFRDPKVFINTVRGGFSMVVAAGHWLEFYYSENLLSWEKTGEFAPEVSEFSEICECPDCFPVETEDGIKWILTLSLTSHVMPYFVGKFDGDTFIEDVVEPGEGVEQGISAFRSFCKRRQCGLRRSVYRQVIVISQSCRIMVILRFLLTMDWFHFQ